MASGPLLAYRPRSYVTGMDDLLALPKGPLTEASLALVRSTESQPIVDHSIRTFLFARLLAEHEGCLNDAAYDEELLFAATVMHDLGLGKHARAEARFEVEGADLAATVLREQGVAEADVERVWEAIALHSSHGLAERRGLLTYLTYKGVFIDAGPLADAVADGLRKEVLNAYPKPIARRYLAEAIIEHGKRSEAAAPPGSLAGYLLLHQQLTRSRDVGDAAAIQAVPS